MPGPKPPPITLTETERQELEQLRRYSTPQQRARRARIILLAAEGKNNAEIAEALTITLDMVRLWRRRWLVLQPIALADLSVAERLEDLPRPGTPPRLTADHAARARSSAWLARNRNSLGGPSASGQDGSLPTKW